MPTARPAGGSAASRTSRWARGPAVLAVASARPARPPLARPRSRAPARTPRPGSTPPPDAERSHGRPEDMATMGTAPQPWMGGRPRRGPATRRAVDLAPTTAGAWSEAHAAARRGTELLGRAQRTLRRCWRPDRHRRRYPQAAVAPRLVAHRALRRSAPALNPTGPNSSVMPRERG